MSNTLISPIYKSIVRHTVETIAEMRAIGEYGEVSYHNWEARGDEDKLPQHTLLGVEGFGFRENRGLWIIRFGLALSSYRDTNLHTEIELLDFLQQRFGEGCKVPLLNAVTAEQTSELVSVDFEVLPMSQSQLRNYREIGVELRRGSM